MKKNFQQIFAMLSQMKEKNEWLENIKVEYFQVPYLDYDGNEAIAKGCIYFPEAEGPRPLVYVSHYKINKDAAELAWYLKEGWIVACPYEDQDPNTEVTRNGLISNSALLYELRHRPEVDATKIAITGGSAGGYSGTMLSALHLSACVTCVKGSFMNVYFNFHHYAPYTGTFNLPVFLSLKDKERANLLVMLRKLPIPFAIVFNTFRNAQVDERLADLEIAAAVSPTFLTKCFSNPYMETHNTSDILVPVDQVTRSFTYDEVSEDLPKDYKIKLNDFDMPEEFNRSFVEALPEGSYTERLLPAVPVGTVEEMPFDEKPFQINIYDGGAPDSHGSHDAGRPAGVSREIAYLKHYFAIGNRSQFLTDEKLELLLERYAGKSIYFPTHEGEIYGSLAIYQKEVNEELLAYSLSHPEDNLQARVQAIYEKRPELKMK